MKKYLQVAKNTVDEYLTYRLNFVMWRVRNVIRILIVYFLWLAIFTERTNVFGYNQTTMLTYVLGISVISAFVFSTRTQEIATEINEGDLSNYLLKPIGYFRYLLGRDVADKLFNLGFAIIEFVLLYLFLHPPIFIQSDPVIIFMTFLSLAIAVILYMLISILLGFIAFWSPETWGPRFLFIMLLDFFAGGLFPLDILPKVIYNILQLLPLSYLIYFPMKIYLGQLSQNEILRGIIISIIWVLILWFLALRVWKIGLKSYTAVGR